MTTENTKQQQQQRHAANVIRTRGCKGAAKSKSFLGDVKGGGMTNGKRDSSINFHSCLYPSVVKVTPIVNGTHLQKAVRVSAGNLECPSHSCIDAEGELLESAMSQ
ncbi:hypothetical protein CDAR_506231 [Caerostris darwini]|uniref:Uncharacterized protein n=1 Tax=Caerostris darwini TaxID=1538125 RepID=A0AAV4SAN7_9ARAC|nr:hypothetical protein CDAR_506231 [Caerostris darwini]